MTVVTLYGGMAGVYEKIIMCCVSGLLAINLTSCSSSLSEKQKAAITSIGVADHEETNGA